MLTQMTTNPFFTGLVVIWVSLMITNGDGSVTSIDLDHLEKAIQFWSQKSTR